MTKAQYEREKIREMREARDRELRLLAQGRMTSNPHYVQDVVDFLWLKLLDRKLQRVDSLPAIERRRLNTLITHYSLVHET